MLRLAPLRPEHWIHCDHGADGAATREGRAHRAGGRAEIDRQIETAQHQAEPMRKFVGNLIEKERLRTKP
jgi:hypothetical protein